MPYHILIVEDDVSLRQLYSLYLERGEFGYTAVGSVQEALDVLPTLVVDILMTDINLGEEIDGLDLIKIVRRNNEYDHIKIVTLTSFPTHYNNTDSSQIDLSLNKPIAYDYLIASLYQLLENHLA